MSEASLSYIDIADFNGLWDRAEDDSCPKDHLLRADNLIYFKRGFGTRFGMGLDLTKASILRTHVYKIPGQADRLLILTSANQIFDSTDLSTPILTVVGMIDFSMVSLFDKAYISPHNGLTGLPGEKVYVYDGSGVARAAAGNGPSGFTLTATNSATSGKIEEGFHMFGVAYETVSGFITRMGPEFLAQLDAPGGKKAVISNLPIGGATVVARWILATKIIADFSGNQEDYEPFFLYRVPNNTDTSATVDFYDADLVSSADYLFDSLTEIPAGVQLFATSKGRLGVMGENANSHIVRFSKAGQPESHNEADGFLIVKPGDAGGGVKNALEHRDLIILFKSQRTYMTQDNGAEPTTWAVNLLDSAIGTECFGVSQVLDAQGATLERFLIADRSGLLAYDGAVPEFPLTWKVSSVWERINLPYFHKIQVVQDPVKKRLYISLPLDAATEPSHVLYGDYANGFNEKTVKWSLWNFPTPPTSILVDVNNSTKQSTFKYASSSGNVYKYDESRRNDFGSVIAPLAETFKATFSKIGGISHIVETRLKIAGVGNLTLSVRSDNDAVIYTPPDKALVLLPTDLLPFQLNFVASFGSVRISTDAIDEYFVCLLMKIVGTEIWADIPQ